MKVTHIPIKEVKIYELVKIPASLFPKYCLGTDVSWCGGYLLYFTEMRTEKQYDDLFNSQTIHIPRLTYCEMTEFPKEIKNMYGTEIKLLDATYAPVFVEITRFLKEIDKK